MASPQYSLAWGSHKKNICCGLSSLQQNGEFVDMTLAADGHLVKVHQVIIALASPYIKELISSAQCTHPVIFLNKISYTTLSLLLEYIYTGEVVVSAEYIDELVEAGKDLHIKGLVDMKLLNTSASEQEEAEKEISCKISEDFDGDTYFEICPSMTNENIQVEKQNTESYDETMFLENTEDYDEPVLKKSKMDKESLKPSDSSGVDNVGSVIQYTVSNQGSLQMILNRFLYYLKHSNKDSTQQWRCVDYLNSKKCPALVNTKDNFITQRMFSHTHPFHDNRILKKVKAGTIFSNLHLAEEEGYNKRNELALQKQ